MIRIIRSKREQKVNETSRNQSTELKTLGLKATGPRMKILELFQRISEQGEGVVRHLSAEDVYRMLVEEKSDIGLATVYRVLTQFETAGILVRHHFDSGRATYELAEGQHHDHIVCLRCGRVEEFVDVDIERMQKSVARKYGYELCDHSLILYGICEACRKEEELKNEKQ